MGHSTRNGGRIQTFHPNDKDSKFYIASSENMGELMLRIKTKWPDIDISNIGEIQITTEYIQTDHIGYDLYDPSDYTCFLVIERIKQEPKTRTYFGENDVRLPLVT
jgi:hypothetical protein